MDEQPRYVPAPGLANLLDFTKTGTVRMVDLAAEQPEVLPCGHSYDKFVLPLPGNPLPPYCASCKVEQIEREYDAL